MSNRYRTPSGDEIERTWHIGRQNDVVWPREISPRQLGPIIRWPDATGLDWELSVGRWGLIPGFAKTAGIKFSTNNARAEELDSSASYKVPWHRGQRCIIPASTFDEPNWESGKNEWWRLARADGDPWGLAGLWATWADESSGEVHECFTMLTLNANSHPLLSRFHKPKLDPATKKPLQLDLQDKRGVIAIEHGDVDRWLTGTTEDAKKLLRLAPAKAFSAGPA